MSDEGQSGSVAFLCERLYEQVRPAGFLKRKFGQSISASSQTWHAAYPSPPMSNPPSPPRQSPPSTTSVADDPRIGVSGTVLAPLSTSLLSWDLLNPSGEHIASTWAHDYALGSSQNPAPSSNVEDLSKSVNALPSGQNVFSVGPVASSSTTVLGNTTNPRTGRKAKAHVASACTNCKRAHLSCDSQRPCTRCVTSGKQDSCFDIPHKKRGRPRLREENEFKAGSTTLEQVAPAPSHIAPFAAGSSTARPIARTRHQRTESLRSLRSQTSDGSSGSSLPTPGFPPTLQPGWIYQPSRPPSSGMSAAIAPTAFLDLDFNVIRANRPFQQILSNDQDVRGKQLQDLVVAADGESFIALRARLKGERESREPAYMPPMLQSGEDPIRGVSEDDIERLAGGFSDQTYTWSRAVPGPQRETFPARVRLAKATAYFVVVTLPSFRPVDVLPPQSSATLPPPGFMIPPPRAPTLPGQSMESRTDTQTAPPRSYYPSASPMAGVQQFAMIAGQPLQGRPYASIQPYPTGPFLVGTPQRPPPVTPRLPTAEPPMHVTPITPLTTAPMLPSQRAPAMLLPPIAATPPSQVLIPTAGSSGAAEVQQGPSDDDEESPKKRRRMDISDVLQQ